MQKKSKQTYNSIQFVFLKLSVSISCLKRNLLNNTFEESPPFFFKLFGVKEIRLHQALRKHFSILVCMYYIKTRSGFLGAENLFAFPRI